MLRLGFETSDPACLLYLLGDLVLNTAVKVSWIGSYRAFGFNLRKLSIDDPQTLPLVNLSGVILPVNEKFSARGYCLSKVAMQLTKTGLRKFGLEDVSLEKLTWRTWSLGLKELARRVSQLRLKKLDLPD